MSLFLVVNSWLYNTGRNELLFYIAELYLSYYSIIVRVYSINDLYAGYYHFSPETMAHCYIFFVRFPIMSFFSYYHNSIYHSLSKQRGGMGIIHLARTRYMRIRISYMAGNDRRE